MPGNARSLSVIASPQVGKATQAIDQRRTLEISSDKLHAVVVQDFLPNRLALLGCQIGEQMLWCAVRRMPGLKRAADFAQRRFQLQLIVVVDAAVFDVQAVEHSAVALLVPAHVIVEAADVFRIGRRQRLADSILRPWP